MNTLNGRIIPLMCMKFLSFFVWPVICIGVVFPSTGASACNLGWWGCVGLHISSVYESIVKWMLSWRVNTIRDKRLFTRVTVSFFQSMFGDHGICNCAVMSHLSR